MSAAAHPILYTLLGLVAAAETGLLGYLVHTFNHDGYPSGRGSYGTPNGMKSLIILLLFTSAWTVFFIMAFICYAWNSITAFLANLMASTFWLLITIVLWAVSTALFHNTREGGQCQGAATISTCRELETVEALGWTALGLAALCLVAGICSWHSHRGYRNNAYRV